MREIRINIAKVPLNSQTQDAIGYLSLWAYEHYDKLNIHLDFANKEGARCPDLLAYYQNTATNSQYVIGAIFSGNSYSFHS